jgi:ribosomal protein L28
VGMARKCGITGKGVQVGHNVSAQVCGDLAIGAATKALASRA